MTTLFKNNAASKLASGLSVGATSMNVTPGDGDKFPVVAAPDVTYVTIENATYTEIVKITARASGSDSMTIVKAQEGTTDRAWLTGDTVSMRITAAQAELGANAQAVAAAAMTAHEAAADPHPGYTTAAELLAAVNTLQPLDAELTSLALMDPARVAEITTLSAFIGSLLNDADQATALSTLGALLNGILSKSAAYSVVAADRGKLIDCTTGTWALTIDPALGAGFAIGVRNSGTGVITLTPTTGTIDGAATIDLGPGDSCLIVGDGTDLLSVGRNNGIGVNQSYQPTSPNPLILGVTYYNTFGRPVDLNVAGAVTSTTGGYLNITFNGGTPIRIAGGYTPSGGVAYACIVTVPAGDSFVLSGSGMTITDSNFLR